MTDSVKAIFLSYASQDADIAHRICTALRAAGVEVWFDQSELRGGDAWDASIRRQIKACDLFMPLISANTRARTEGYFRLEWKLAVDRSHLIAAERPFLIPVVIDDRGNDDTTVPDRFRELHWTKLEGGVPTTAFVERISHLVATDSHETKAQLAIQVADATAPSPSQRRGNMRMTWRTSMAAAGILLLMIAIGWSLQKRDATSLSIVPYSAEDLRLTFAVLPLQVSENDPEGAQVANATLDGEYKSLQERPEAAEEIKLAPRKNVTLALTQYASLGDLAKSMKVHFLIRGSVARAPSGYDVTLAALDGETERVLSTTSLLIPAGSLTPSSHEEIDEAFRSLLFPCLESEVARARQKPDANLDVRDLTFRAESDWYRKRMSGDEKGAYIDAQALLKRALALAPDNPEALRLTVNVNLCECNHAWSNNIDEQQAIGEAALERFLSLHPEDPLILQDKASLYELRNRYPEALVVLDFILTRHPQNSDVMREKAFVLLRLGRPDEALVLANSAYAAHPNRWGRAELLAAVDYELTDYAAAEHFAQMAITKMSKTDLRDSNSGTVRLTLIAAAAHVHDESVKDAALSDLAAAVPELTSLRAIRKWMSPQSTLYHYEPLLDGLRLAGFHD